MNKENVLPLVCGGGKREGFECCLGSLPEGRGGAEGRGRQGGHRQHEYAPVFVWRLLRGVTSDGGWGG